MEDINELFMHISFRSILVGIGVGLGVCSFAWFAEAGTYQVALAECQKRTGLGEGICKTLIKNNLSVESCKKQTSLSDDDCAKRIKEIQNDPDFSGIKTSPIRPSIKPSTPLPTSATSTSQGVARISELRIKKERELTELQSRTEALIRFSREKGMDVSAVESALSEFKKKSEELLLAYDTFRQTYADTMNDPASTRKAIREEARGLVNRSRSSLLEQYRAQIFDPLRVMWRAL